MGPNSYSHVLHHNILVWNQPVHTVMSSLPPVLRSSQVEEQRRPLLEGQLSRTSAHVIKLGYRFDLLQLCNTKKRFRSDVTLPMVSGPAAVGVWWLTFITGVGSSTIVYLVESSWLTVGTFTAQRNMTSQQRRLVFNSQNKYWMILFFPNL